jgi:plasmid stability protein
MAQFIVRNLEDDIRAKLRDLARQHGRNMEEEVRDILRGAVMGEGTPRRPLGSRLARRFSAHGHVYIVAERNAGPTEFCKRPHGHDGLSGGLHAFPWRAS